MHCICIQALNAELSTGKLNLDEVMLAGAELKKNAPNADDVARLDRDVANVKDRYEGLAARCSDKLAKLEEAVPMLQKFHDEHERLLAWLQRVEPELRAGGKEPTGNEAVKQLEVGH
jgi:dystonin